jgi:hypothetical protein
LGLALQLYPWATHHDGMSELESVDPRQNVAFGHTDPKVIKNIGRIPIKDRSLDPASNRWRQGVISPSDELSWRLWIVGDVGGVAKGKARGHDRLRTK